MCKHLANSNATDDIGRIVDVFRKVINPFENFCLPMNYEIIVETYKQSVANSPAVDIGIRQFIYQECSLLGWLPTTNSPYQPFGTGISTDFFYTICKDVFDNKLVIIYV